MLASNQIVYSTYDISPNGVNASFSCCVSISALRSPTKMWNCSAMTKETKTHKGNYKEERSQVQLKLIKRLATKTHQQLALPTAWGQSTWRTLETHTRIVGNTCRSSAVVCRLSAVVCGLLKSQRAIAEVVFGSALVAEFWAWHYQMPLVARPAQLRWRVVWQAAFPVPGQLPLL